MHVRICDKAVNKKKKEIITNIRMVECTAIYDDAHEGRRAHPDIIKSSLQNVLLCVNPETKKATVLEMWLRDMVGE